ncbi:MAG: hypothetical protein RLZZ399_228 [Verrucomicrobiota bacterium]
MQRLFGFGDPCRFARRSAAFRGSSRLLVGLASVLYFAGATYVCAHTGSDGGGGFLRGFSHPWLGGDHVVAMLAVGLWGAILGRSAACVLPLLFPTVMAFGGALGVRGVEIPSVEIGIALSGIILGGMVLFSCKVPLRLAGSMVSVFAVFHGHAHGRELPASASPVTYSAGFVFATGLLHLFGIVTGELSRWPWGAALVRGCGGLIAATGLGYLFRVI